MGGWVGGRPITGVACGMPLSSAYAASKHALEVFTSSLRQEMHPFRVKASQHQASTHSATWHPRSCLSQHPPHARSALDKNTACLPEGGLGCSQGGSQATDVPSPSSHSCCLPACLPALGLAWLGRW